MRYLSRYFYRYNNKYVKFNTSKYDGKRLETIVNTGVFIF